MLTKIDKSIINDTLELIDKDEGYLLADFGGSFTLDYTPKDELYNLSYDETLKFGAEIIYALWYEMFACICDQESLMPKKWILDILNGNNDKGKLIEALIIDIVNTYGLKLNTAAVGVALLIKKGFLWMCAQGRKSQPDRSLKEIILQEKRNTRLYLKEREERKINWK